MVSENLWSVVGSRRPWVFGPRSSARHVPIVLGNCTFIILSVVGGGGGYYFLEFMLRGVIEFFCDEGGGSGHFV